MKIPVVTIQTKTRQLGGSENFYQRVLDQLKGSMTVLIPCDNYVEAQILIDQIIQRDFPCAIKLSWKSNLSNIDYSNGEAVRDGWELYQDDTYGMYARQFSGVTLIPNL